MTVENFSYRIEYDHFLASGKARRFVQNYSLCRSTIRNMPIAQHDALYFQLGEPGVIIDGEFWDDQCIAVLSQHSPSFVSTIGEQKFWIVVLYRGSLTRLLNLDARKQKNQFMTWGHIPWINELCHGLRAAKNQAERVALCDQAFALAADRALGDSPIEASLLQMNQAKGDLSVGDLADRMGVNRKTLERAFQARLKTTPHMELRIRRFYNTLEPMVANPALRWRDLDFAPYCDQSHFLREARLFLKRAPSKLMPGGSTEVHHFYPQHCFAPDMARGTSEDIPDWEAALRERIAYLELCN